MVATPYEFLSESFLYIRSNIDNRYASISEKELKVELQKYRDFQLANSDEIEKQIILRNISSLKLFTGSTKPILPLLKQSALYLDQIIIADPLFPFTHESSDATKNMGDFLSLNGGGYIARARLATSVDYLQSLEPMIRSGFVVVLPLSVLFEPSNEIPLRYSENGFFDMLPESLLEFYRRRAIVESVKKTQDGMIIDGSNEIGRGIHVRFKNHGFEDAKGYLLFQNFVESVNKETRTISSAVSLPDSPPDKFEYDHWVSQSINQTAEHSYKRMLLENRLAARFSANYLCSTEFEFDLLEQFFPADKDISTQTINSLLGFDLPFMEGVNPRELMLVRHQDGEAFQNFRCELDRHFRELRLIKDADELRIKTENAFHEIAEVQVAQINKKMGELNRQFKFELALGAAGLIGAVQTGGLSLAAVAFALMKGYKSYNEYLVQKQQNPCFFLWKVLNRKK